MFLATSLLWLLLLKSVSGQFLGLETIPYGCGYFQYPNATLDVTNPPRIIAEALANVDNVLQRMVTDLGIPGVSFGVVYDQQLVHYKGVGVTNFDTMAAPTIDTIYRIGSITKVFTTLMTFALRDNGMVSMDDPISKYNTDFSINNPWGITNQEKQGLFLTLKHLASQISGLPREAPCEWADANSNWCDDNTSTILARLADYDLIHPTDVQGSYSNLAYALLGNVLPEYFESDYETELNNWILKPLGMDSSGLHIEDNANKANAATGYSEGVEQDWVDIHWVGPAGQMFSSVADMVTFMKQFLGAVPGRYEEAIADSTAGSLQFRGETLREMLRPVFLNADLQTGFGSPWEMQMLQGHYLRTKGGNINGFSTNMALIPELKLGVVALVNTDTDGSFFTMTPLEALIPAFEGWLSARDADFQPLYPIDPSIYVGTYTYEDDPEFTVELEDDEDGNSWLVLKGILEPTEYRLVYLRKNGREDNFVALSTATRFDTCWLVTLDAMDNSVITFTRNSNGDVTKATNLEFWGWDFKHQTEVISRGEARAALKKKGAEKRKRRSRHPLGKKKRHF